MRIIILNQFYYPDHSATSQLMTDLAESLVEHGVEVTALAGRGRYNGSGGGDDGGALPSREEHKGVRIERAWATSYGKGSIAGRLADYLSFYIGATWRLLRVPDQDIVMVLTTPPLISLIALLIGRYLRGMRLVALVQDVYPDVAVALGTLPAGWYTTRFMDWLNLFVLRRADRIVVLGECMREHITAKIGDDMLPPIDVIHNWADGKQITPLLNEENSFTIEHKLNDQFVVLFSGNFGRVNEFHTVLEAARMLRERSDILFLFIGEGVKAAEIKAFTHRHNLRNVCILPYQPRSALRYSLAAGHVSLVTLANGLAGLSVPSKTYGILAAGRPILFVGDVRSDVARLVAANDCGAVIASDDSQRLAQVVSEWASDPVKLDQLGRAARALFETRFDRPHAVNAYLETFTKCLRTAHSRR